MLQVGTGDGAVREPWVPPGGESTGLGRALSPLSHEKTLTALTSLSPGEKLE